MSSLLDLRKHSSNFECGAIRSKPYTLGAGCSVCWRRDRTQGDQRKVLKLLCVHRFHVSAFTALRRK